MKNWTDRKILVAEDEMGNFFLIACMLEESGIMITHAENGKKAVDLATNEPFDVILMDIKMPLLDGFEATAEIRKNNIDIPIIAQSAFAYKREECIAAGFTDYLAKPFNEAKLVEMITQYLKGV